jgi:XTP/dITP diphosphohydrolase
MPHAEENADDFQGNARIKAMALRDLVPAEAMVLADDSGLCVDSLDGDPGVRSSRFAGDDATDDQNTSLLLKRMADVPLEQRAAHFRCVLVLLEADGAEHVFDGRCQGRINFERTGDGGFGYDPVFQPEGYDASFAVLPAETKNRISHRFAALRQLTLWAAGRVNT